MARHPEHFRSIAHASLFVKIRKDFQALIKSDVYWEDICTTPPGLANFRDRFCERGALSGQESNSFFYLETFMIDSDMRSGSSHAAKGVLCRILCQYLVRRVTHILVGVFSTEDTGRQSFFCPYLHHRLRNHWRGSA